MAKELSDREKQLINARKACLMLIEYATGELPVGILRDEPEPRELIADLLEQFGRLDAKERRQQKAGKKGAAHGNKGGRPRKEKVDGSATKI